MDSRRASETTSRNPGSRDRATRNVARGRQVSYGSCQLPCRGDRMNLVSGGPPMPPPHRPHRRWHIKAAAFCALFLFFSIPVALSDNYYRGGYSCEGFREMERLYRSDPESIHLRMGYARCLLVKGEDTEGLSILHNIADQHNQVRAAFIIAEYTKSGGKFTIDIDENNINEAIDAFGRVIFLINLDPRYPHNENSIYEESRQMELSSHYQIPRLYWNKFKYGAQGTDNIHLMTSPSYDGNRNLSTYPDYAPYTIDSLNNVVKFSDICTSLPYKLYHKKDYHDEHTKACSILKEGAIDLLPLEEKRLVLLATESCSSDLNKCKEYQRLKREEMIPIIRRTTDRIKEIW